MDFLWFEKKKEDETEGLVKILRFIINSIDCLMLFQMVLVYAGERPTRRRRIDRQCCSIASVGEHTPQMSWRHMPDHDGGCVLVALLVCA